MKHQNFVSEQMDEPTWKLCLDKQFRQMFKRAVSQWKWKNMKSWGKYPIPGPGVIILYMQRTILELSHGTLIDLHHKSISMMLHVSLPLVLCCADLSANKAGIWESLWNEQVSHFSSFLLQTAALTFSWEKSMLPLTFSAWTTNVYLAVPMLRQSRYILYRLTMALDFIGTNLCASVSQNITAENM